VYICESRYTARIKAFKKIKVWAVPVASVRLVQRDVPLPVVRVASMFAKPPQERPPAAVTDTAGFVDKVRRRKDPCVTDFNSSPPGLD